MTTISVNFIADNSGTVLTFVPKNPETVFSIDNVSLKELLQAEVDDNIPVKELFSGTTDEGREIQFRVDSQPIQLQSQFELISNPLAIVTRLQRGTLLKCFVSLDGEDFYEIEGTASKGVSILKIHSRDKSNIPSPAIAQKVQISWRDGSKQLCRLIQSAIIFMPGTMELND